jgi:hypothetical protein
MTERRVDTTRAQDLLVIVVVIVVVELTSLSQKLLAKIRFGSNGPVKRQSRSNTKKNGHSVDDLHGRWFNNTCVLSES